jgi:hypothetical protein
MIKYCHRILIVFVMSTLFPVMVELVGHFLEPIIVRE